VTNRQLLPPGNSAPARAGGGDDVDDVDVDERPRNTS
jgi:hypothetical protein